ncbi:endolytic transglycosylase MltG [Tetragenococcus koreensis]|uniref:Endolytic murein transglycosylase n=1 Tax=Tetragenococcus koreensis TaxID=290335 RepID=A0AAN4RJ96_9ENTE|nr:endolytic transglycosylase MltG [Tetragenococcus koreensis]AYW45229.1 endolytic transglycosylase MltG [Tetragenococcus koreensis]MCF1620415.1 endolytic transglycosylase MltG [Tetragenococcus koreensis]MCF1657896.1 endolytic transglycosylase MltG [Tetragenococcus koreensis]MCF1687025.1 endolytic transglycosylase MltG [Tetragenococcus koreensis]GEN90348.1 aminodeoxychorismate lyase [Tetragenococcus koreensis]
MNDENQSEDNQTSNKNKKTNNNNNKPKDVKKRKSRRKKEDRVVRKIVLVIILALAIVGLIFGFSTYNYVKSSIKPLDPNSEESISVTIPNGSSNKMIGEILEEENIINSGMVFNYYMKFNNQDGFQAGEYVFSPSMTLNEIADSLKKGESALNQAKIAVPEGYDVEEIASDISEQTEFSEDDFLDLMNDDDFFNELQEEYPELLNDAAEAEDVRYRLEGYLFPATYDYQPDMSLKELVQQMVATTDSIMENYYDDIDDSDLNVQETMTVASLVEKEGVTEEDRKQIAQVFFNRTEADMPLQSDISILYALGEHKELVTYEDLEVDSPYNLYQNTGYGPGPFDNPSEDSIDAVLNPTDNDYYYFVADVSTGNVYYAETYEEHNELIEKYMDD